MSAIPQVNVEEAMFSFVVPVILFPKTSSYKAICVLFY